MLKRKLIAYEAVADILWFVEDGDDVDDGDAADDLNEIYDDSDINVAQCPRRKWWWQVTPSTSH